jgi:hypothetical protein
MRSGQRTPESVAGAGLFTNPVHVIDLAIALPAHVIAGVALLRRRPAGPLVALFLLLAFGVPMAASIAGMMIVNHMLGASAAVPAGPRCSGLRRYAPPRWRDLFARLEPRA